MHEEWTDKLSDYLDGELPPEEHQAVAAHLAGCADCARVLEELREVVTTAATLPSTGPSTDLWNGIAARITTERRSSGPIAGPWRRFTFSLPQLAAASVLLAVVSGWTTLHFLTRRAAPPLESSVAAPSTPTASTTATPVIALASFDDREYDAAVADLERALNSQRDRLDPATIKVVEDNLAIIDRAVDEARRALADDPANGYLSGYLVETRRHKLDLLRQAASLAADMN